MTGATLGFYIMRRFARVLAAVFGTVCLLIYIIDFVEMLRRASDLKDVTTGYVARMAPMLHKDRKAVQLHFGGGSPTFLRPDELRRLGDIIHKHFTFSPDIEASVEVDPRRLTRDHLVALKEVGFNRASMGVQDFNPVVQQAIHRIQPREMTQTIPPSKLTGK